MRQRKKEATKLKIQQAAIELMHGYGYAATTMQMVAEKADVALRTLYNYYPTKEAIVGSYMRDVVRGEEEKNWGELMGLDTTYERLLLVCRKTADWSVANPVLSEIYASDPRNYCYAATDEVPRSGIDEVAARILRLGQQQGDVSPKVSVEVLVRQFMGILYQGILTWLGNPADDLFIIFQEGIDILFKGIRVQDVEPGVILWGMFC